MIPQPFSEYISYVRQLTDCDLVFVKLCDLETLWQENEGIKSE